MSGLQFLSLHSFHLPCHLFYPLTPQISSHSVFSLEESRLQGEESQAEQNKIEKACWKPSFWGCPWQANRKKRTSRSSKGVRVILPPSVRVTTHHQGNLHNTEAEDLGETHANPFLLFKSMCSFWKPWPCKNWVPADVQLLKLHHILVGHSKRVISKFAQHTLQTRMCM